VPLLSIPPLHLLLAYAPTLLISALGFLRVDYYISLGYGFSIAALAVVFPVVYGGQLDGPLLAADALLFLYGMRLGIFLFLRERQPSFERERLASLERSARVRGVLRLVIWVSVAALYVAMYAPVMFALAAGPSAGGVVLPLGVALMVVGLGLEALADRQKSVFKASNPSRFCDAGLYRLVRSPNYFGEMMFWLGTFITGLGAYRAPLDWLIALLGLVCIELIMLGSARRLELKQAERYGGEPAYRDYAARVPVLFPLLPLYSLKRLRVYLG
jgi:steroid 5-alpha reductase family enzyme